MLSPKAAEQFNLQIQNRSLSAGSLESVTSIV